MRRVREIFNGCMQRIGLHAVNRRIVMALEKYNKMRDFSKTPEPSGKTKRTKSRTLQFVIQKHNASRLHYDFRLEHNGVLLSWAVPKGPSLNPADKRLAVQTEDHPFEYRKFEGLIPKGEYGGGEVIIWDKGSFYPERDGAPVKDLREAEKVIADGMRRGNLKFTLDGDKLHGSWALVKLKNKEKDWLLIKHTDDFSAVDREVVDEDESVVSGRTIEDLQEKFGTKAAKRTTNAASKRVNAKARKSAYPPVIQPMLASLAPEPFSKEGWIYEPKFDGIRAIAYIHNGNVRLLSRRGLDLTGRYPVLADALSLQKGDLVLDGEIVAFDNQGRPSFQLLQQRSGLSRSTDVRQAEGTIPIQFYAFDILYKDGALMVNKPLSDRKNELKKVLVQNDSIRLVDKIEGSGEDAFRACVENGLEGILAKRADSLYEIGKRSKSWLKVKATRSDDFVICGYTAGNGSRSNLFGALVLGYYKDGELKYAGSVGTGFTEKSMQAILKTLKGLEMKSCPFSEKAACKLKATWLKPVVVAQVKYAEFTRDMILRVPVFQHLRSDIDPKQAGPNPIVQPDASSSEAIGADANSAKGRVFAGLDATAKSFKEGSREVEVKGKRRAAEVKSKSKKSGNSTQQSVDQNSIDTLLESLQGNSENLAVEIDGHKISFSSLNKILWPGLGKKYKPVTKRDYAIYLCRMAPLILPHLKDRPLTLIRYPNGVEGKRFFQKHWEHKVPDFVETVTYFSEKENKDDEFLLCNNLPTLMWLAQIADLELHTVHTRITPEHDAHDVPSTFTGSLENINKSLLNYPDFMVLDLDPYLYSGKEAANEEPELNKKGFKKVSELALMLKEILDSLKLKGFIKTSGKTGLHIYVPVVRNADNEELRSIAATLAKHCFEQKPGDVTIDWSVKKRTGKVFFDFNMNARGKTLASIYSPRNSILGTVSTPLDWSELGSVYPTDFTMDTVPDRVAQLGDLWSEILNEKNDLQIFLEQVRAKDKQVKRRRR